MGGEGTVPCAAFPRCEVSGGDRGIIPSFARENLEAALRQPGDGRGQGERSVHSLLGKLSHLGWRDYM